MKRTMYTLLAVLLFAATRSAWAGTINVSTGLDASYNLITVSGQADAHWSLVPGGTAWVITPSSPDWWGQYIPNGPNPAWISNNAVGNYNGPAPYTLSTFNSICFGYELSTVSLSGFWAIADGGTLSLNGNIIGTLPAQVSANWSSLHSFSVAAGSPFFNQGLNALSLTVSASDNYYEAARLEGLLAGSSASPVPEPSTLLLVGPGALALASMLRRRLFGP